MEWLTKTFDQAAAAALARELGASRNPESAQTLARLLVLRGITESAAAHCFLNPEVSHLHSPERLLGMRAAIERIDAAIERKETMLIYGDYDVDGTTAIVILKTAIEMCGGTTDFHVPHRIREGYDLRGEVIERAAAAGIRLIISVDMGIRAFAAAETAGRLGVDLIVTDHHLPGPDGVPQALAVINPNQSGCDYPCKSICGAAVAFKVAHALLLKKRPDKDLTALLKSFLKIVAIATIADAVPLTDENRVFAKIGLESLRTAVNPGLKSLLEVAELGGRPLNAGEVAFRIAPRINAAGRMDVAREVIDLFTVKDAKQAQEIAARLDQLNSQRQEEERRILECIWKRFEEDSALRETFCYVVDGDGWHRGVIGITATRVVEKFGRPALVISRDGEEAHGSGRSIRPFHLLNALESCAHLFTRFGGHSHAVGFSLPSARVEELRAHLDGYARERLTLADFEPGLPIDAEIDLAEITPQLLQALKQMEPFGVGNREPVFSVSARLVTPPKLIKEKHIKLKIGMLEEGPDQLSDAAIQAMPRCHPDAASVPRRKRDWRQAVTFEAVGWRMAERCEQERLLAGDVLDLAFTLEQNEHTEFGGIELTLRDFRRNVKSASVVKTETAAAQ
jgi:single-stranded-DNA-specific exonuclease